ncbi:bacillithiol biosynthesis deacetylase BshB2 [Shouchella lonarensis]|uniref:Bacillithiol biosynthesis deacetylase BshB2 n=1 Tax=Shouchella lonarensis TaxID=1464122 RepID=A0A1G6J5C5_9BACI|nr:bacillithiol biosynthesis deacetylase BshB2 [Shouchella lonarensis]SDC13921.1 bacillithiol biosynthesis deacetylase BshB2 [Shouchella lonarensis]
MRSERHVLVIFPHPDDEAFAAAGTIRAHVVAGTPVTYACLTLGEMGRNLGNPPVATRESLPHIRRKELQAASKVMGISDVRMMGFRDKTLEFEPLEVLKNLVLQLVAELSPSLVISFYPGYAVHPDHDTTGRAVADALQEIPIPDRPTFHAVAFSNNHEANIGKADVVHDVSRYADVKLNALRAHASQLAWTLPDLEAAYYAGVPEAVQRIAYERFWTFPFTEGD